MVEKINQREVRIRRNWFFKRAKSNCHKSHTEKKTLLF